MSRPVDGSAIRSTNQTDSMHATRLQYDGTRPRSARVWLPLLLVGTTLLAILAVPALSTEPSVAPIVEAPREPRSERAEPRPLLVEAKPIPLQAVESFPASEPVSEPSPLRQPAKLSAFIRIAPHEGKTKPSFARKPPKELPAEEATASCPASTLKIGQPFRRQAFTATRGSRLIRQTQRRSDRSQSPALAKRLIAALAAMTDAGNAVSERSASARPRTKGIVQAVPFDPTGAKTSSASPSDLSPSASGLAEIVDGRSLAGVERKLPPVFKLKPAQAVTRKPLIQLAPQDLAKSTQPQAATESESQVVLKSESQVVLKSESQVVLKAAPTDLVSHPSPLSALVSVPRSRSVVELAKPAMPESENAVATSQAAAPQTPTSQAPTSQAPTSQTAAATQPQTPAAQARESIVQFAAQDLLAATLQEGTQYAEPLPLPETAANETAANENDVAADTLSEEIASIDDGLRPIGRILAAVAPSAGDMPRDYASARFAREGQVAHRMGVSRESAESMVMWEAPGVCYRPLYFEDVNVERHGYKVPLVQPMLSAAHFFGRAPLLPYMMVTERSRECGYSLGHYRPGDYAPYSLYIPRPKLTASALEATAVLGVILAFP